MRYDDRLATVLRLHVSSPAVARIQYNQLIDLLGTCPAEARSDVLDQAYARLAQLSAQIPAADRAGALASPGLRLRAPRLVAALTMSEPQVAAAGVRAAALSEEQWLDLIPALPPGARAVLRVRNDFGDRVRALLARLGVGDHALPGLAGKAPAQTVVGMPARAPEVANPAPVSGIGAIVERIEAFRRAREASGVVDESIAASGGLPQLPLGDTIARPAAPLTTVDFATDAGGRISWCERGAAPMLVGRNLAAIESLRLAIRQRLPIRATPITLAGAPAISGDWQADAMPQFDAQGGRFTGYLGRLRRTSVAAAAEETPSIAMREADGLRQVLHELRTPVNAIQGFAEIIQHQLYGPTPHEYRALSAVIVADAARILAGFEELERLARLGSGAIQPAQGECDFAEIARTAAGRMAPQAQARMLDLSFHGGDAPLPVALATIEAERLCWRLLTALAGCADAGEALDFELEPCGPMMSFTLTLPKRLATLDDRTLFSGDATLAADAGGAATVGMFGSGFALRLARVEAQAAGGNLIRNKEKLNLSLPLLTRMAMAHSHSGLGGLDRMGTPVA